MADELTEALIRGVQHGQQQAYNEQRTQVARDTQARLTEAMALRAQQAESRRPRQIPQQLIDSLLNPDATPDEVAGAFGMAGSYDLQTATKIAGIGATARQRLAREKADQLGEDELRAMVESNPKAAAGLRPGMNRQTAMTIYSQANQNQRDLTFKPDAPPKPPPVKDEEPYYKGYVTKESEVPEAVLNELSMRLYNMPSEDLGSQESIEDGPAKGMSGKEVNRHLLGLATEAQALARGGMSLTAAINQVAPRGLPKPGENRRFRPDTRAKFGGPDTPPPPPIGTGNTPPAAVAPPPVAAAGNRAALDSIIQKAGGDRAKIRDLIRASGIEYTPEDIAYIKSKLGG